MFEVVVAAAQDVGVVLLVGLLALGAGVLIRVAGTTALVIGYDPPPSAPTRDVTDPVGATVLAVGVAVLGYAGLVAAARALAGPAPAGAAAVLGGRTGDVLAVLLAGLAVGLVGGLIRYGRATSLIVGFEPASGVPEAVVVDSVGRTVLAVGVAAVAYALVVVRSGNLQLYVGIPVILTVTYLAYWLISKVNIDPL
jgi:hypothetical protein